MYPLQVKLSGNNMNLPKRSEIKNKISKRLHISESPQEDIIRDIILSFGFRNFIQQHPIGPYYADFAFPSTRVVIEYDGNVHLGREKYDSSRDKYITSLGWRMLRMKNGGNFYVIKFITNTKSEMLAYTYSYETAINYLREAIAEIVNGEKLQNNDFVLKFSSCRENTNGFISIQELIKNYGKL
jgi:very-short-patch-repair endonuclease